MIIHPCPADRLMWLSNNLSAILILTEDVTPESPGNSLRNLIYSIKDEIDTAVDGLMNNQPATQAA